MDVGIFARCNLDGDVDGKSSRLATITGTGEPRIGAHGKPVIFLHPKDFVGTLVELEQA